MTIGARDDWGWVDKRPERDQPDLLRDAEPFNCLTTPADPDMGVRAEVIRSHLVVSSAGRGSPGTSERSHDR